MNREIVPFTTEDEWLNNRKRDLTSSDIPVLFGHGYITLEELIENKRSGIVKEIKMNERMKWGMALQDAIAEEFARQNNWNISKKTEYIRIPELRLGSSFDFEIYVEDEDDKGEAFSTAHLLEIKTVDAKTYKDKWIQGFEIEATPYIELQVQHQLLVSGLKEAYIGVLIGGNQGFVLRRQAREKIHNAILSKAKKFWETVEEI